MAECKTLGDMIDKLVSHTTEKSTTADGKKRIVVIDADIATEENLKMKTDKGKESAMHKQFCARYEAELDLIVKGINTKGGTKKLV